MRPAGGRGGAVEIATVAESVSADRLEGNPVEVTMDRSVSFFHSGRAGSLSGSTDFIHPKPTAGSLKVSMKASIVLLPGDGIGPEVTAEAEKVLRLVATRWRHQFEFKTHLMGGCAIDATGEPLPAEALAACKTSDAVLLGAVGGRSGTTPKRRHVRRRVF